MGSKGTPIPEGEDVPPIEFEDPQPPIEICDQILGGYVRCWGYVETAVNELFAQLLGAHPVAGRTVTASTMNQRTIHDIMEALARQRLSDTEFAAFKQLNDKLGRATTARNRVVHGTWRVKILIGGPGPNKATWERFYEPANPAAYELLNSKAGEQKFNHKYLFTIDRIVELAHEADDLAKRIRSFTASATFIPIKSPQPTRFSP